MRAIDADAIAYESIDSCDTGRHEHYYGTGIIAVRKEDIDAMPTIQPAEPKRGKWIPSDTDGFVCSVCRNGYRNQPTLMGKPMFEFCPVCGAKMEVTA